MLLLFHFVYCSLDGSLLSVCITCVFYIQSNDRSRAVMNAKRELLIGRYPPWGAGGVSGH